MPRVVALGVLVLAGCGGRMAPPGPGSPQAPVPDLRGNRVMLFPVQNVQGVGPGTDAELAFALGQRGGEVDWVLPEEMARAVQASPGMDARIDGLPVAMFLRSEVQRVGDPLYGYLRRVAALVDSDIALIPVVARHRPTSPEKPGAVEIGATVIAVRSGYVLWFGFVEGEAGEGDDPRALASAADALGKVLLPFSVGSGQAVVDGDGSDKEEVVDGKDLASFVDSPGGGRGLQGTRPRPSQRAGGRELLHK